jgi:glycosyltransferase involved in cell wall biosynthesis
MNVLYYYHGRVIENATLEWKKGNYPGQGLYGITELKKYDINVLLQKEKKRLILKIFSISLDFTKFRDSLDILLDKRSIDVIYTAYYSGIAPLIILRGLGVYKKPIVVWQHSSIINHKNPLKKLLYKTFYKGVDSICFFSSLTLKESLESGLITSAKTHVVKWGPDLNFYNNIQNKNVVNNSYISTGKDSRDFDTLVKAFSESSKELILFLTKKELISKYKDTSLNIKTHYLPISATSPNFLASEIKKCYAVTICTLKPLIARGFSQLNTALGCGKPVIMTRNKYVDIDIEKENIGIYVDVNDVSGWIKAINYLSQNPEVAKTMGDNAYRLAKKEYNLGLFARHIAQILMSTWHQSHNKFKLISCN